MSTAETIAPSAPRQSIPCPPPPRTPEDLGLPFSAVTDLLLKVMYFNGTMTGRDLAGHVCIPFAIVEPALRHLSTESLISASGMRTQDIGADEQLTAATQWQLTNLGRERARELIEINQYAGPAPVPIDIYAAVARHQAKTEVRVTRDQLSAALRPICIVIHSPSGLGSSGRPVCRGRQNNGTSLRYDPSW